MDEYEFPTSERRKPTILLEEEQLSRLITRVANEAADAAFQRALSHTYAQIGRGVVNKALYLVGAVMVAAYSYFAGLKKGS
jgi:hypothetical protein